MKQRQYMAHFFQIDSATVAEDKKEDYFFDLFCDEAARIAGGQGSTLTPTASGYQCELRDLTIHKEVVLGCVGLLRPDAPSIREVRGTERQVTANPGEHFLEKNYFIYYKASRVIAWQFNLAANHINNLAALLTALSGQTHAISCHALIDDAFAFGPNVEIQLVDFRVRMPKTVIQQQDVSRLNPERWGLNPFKTMADTNAKSLAIVLSTGREKSNLGGIEGMVRGLLDSSQTRRLRVKMSDAEEPIDLLARRVRRKFYVQMDGRYANAKSAWQGLQDAKDDAKYEIARCI